MAHEMVNHSLMMDFMLNNVQHIIMIVSEENSSGTMNQKRLMIMAMSNLNILVIHRRFVFLFMFFVFV